MSRGDNLTSAEKDLGTLEDVGDAVGIENSVLDSVTEGLYLRHIRQFPPFQSAAMFHSAH